MPQFKLECLQREPGSVLQQNVRRRNRIPLGLGCVYGVFR